jgi:hypothetical protein
MRCLDITDFSQLIKVHRNAGPPQHAEVSPAKDLGWKEHGCDEN